MILKKGEENKTTLKESSQNTSLYAKIFEHLLKPSLISLDLVVWLNVSWSELESLTEDEVLGVVARNSKGASEPALLRELVFRDPAKRTVCHIFPNNNHWFQEENSLRITTRFPAAAALAALAAILTAAGAIIVLLIRRRSENSSSSKRPSQSVVQVDAQGRRYLIAYPPADKLETKPDILNPKPGWYILLDPKWTLVSDTKERHSDLHWVGTAMGDILRDLVFPVVFMPSDWASSTWPSYTRLTLTARSSSILST
ncbi:hypothetical protein MSG28_011701 [Choristoneura fumiferana]|uniref:Uncharacterized protein n=1 Tax=Choristoneura fumiferana TaxID=7141 RepID=A0ACC0KMF8_CHOFU|nr:hypothetical protein MSG28_011701 [Choristoneura fumiferana]